MHNIYNRGEIKEDGNIINNKMDEENEKKDKISENAEKI